MRAGNARYLRLVVLAALVASLGVVIGCSSDETDGSPVETTFTANVSADPAASYRLAAAGVIDALAVRSRQVAAVLKQSNYLDADWRSEIQTELAGFQSIKAQSTALVAPADFSSVHDEVLRTVERYAQAADALSRGIQDNNLSMIQRSADIFAQSSAEVAALGVVLAAPAQQ